MRCTLTGYIKLMIAAIMLAVLPCVVTADGSRLVVGDVISVQVDGEKDFSKNYQVNDAGGILMPVVELVKVVNLNTSEAAAAISKALEKVMVNPQVTVTFLDRGKMQVFVVGQVKRPGLAEIGIGDRLLQALSQAGYDETTDMTRISVRRGDEIITVDLAKYLSGEDLSANVSLKSGDTVVAQSVGSIGAVLVTGHVNKVGSVPLNRGMTFREVMGLIGGPTVEADTEKITVKREAISDPIKIDYKRAMDGDPAADVVLQPGDTIYVPEIETAYYTVMGGVNRPGQYPLKGKLTLSEAIGEAGGPSPSVGDMRKVQLVSRANADSPAGKTSMVDLEKILKTKPMDQPVVQRGDVIFVGIHKQKANAWQMLQQVLPFGWLFR